MIHNPSILLELNFQGLLFVKMKNNFKNIKRTFFDLLKMKTDKMFIFMNYFLLLSIIWSSCNVITFTVIKMTTQE